MAAPQLAQAEDVHKIISADDLIQVTAMGPFDITYINPGDDPRKAESQ